MINKKEFLKEIEELQTKLDKENSFYNYFKKFIKETSMHRHRHNHCDHSVAYCKVCNVCYCTKCGMEWTRASWLMDYQKTWSVGMDSTACNHSNKTS